ncbi:MAG: quinolinate synthase NadA [Planctomycetaceae bacterium]|nr:quinolinate synthase NadA [Planctomycetaceae bacterium]
MRDWAEANGILILAHAYQEGDIQDAAHVVGDSLELARAAKERNATSICFCGVHFMGETAKILNPKARVFVPDLEAGCSLSDACQAPDLAKYQDFLRKKLGREIVTICYINTSAAVKALCDIVCTSGNAVEVVNSVPHETPILFVPDMHLGAWVQEQTGRDNIHLWNGACMVHELFSVKTLRDLKSQHPGAEVLAHPECPKNIRDESDWVRGTAGMLKIVTKTRGKTYIIATEGNMIHRFKQVAPENTYVAAPGASCACNLCPHMQRNTSEKLWRSLQTRSPEVTVDETIAAKARVALERMLAVKTAPVTD